MLSIGAPTRFGHVLRSSFGDIQDGIIARFTNNVLNRDVCLLFRGYFDLHSVIALFHDGLHHI